VTRVTGDPTTRQPRLSVRARPGGAEILDKSPALLIRCCARRVRPWRRASWDEALDLIVRRMRAAGREASPRAGHGIFATTTVRGSTRTAAALLEYLRLSVVSPAIICWALGGFGSAHRLLEPNTKEDMGRTRT